MTFVVGCMAGGCALTSSSFLGNGNVEPLLMDNVESFTSSSDYPCSKLQIELIYCWHTSYYRRQKKTGQRISTDRYYGNYEKKNLFISIKSV